MVAPSLKAWLPVREGQILLMWPVQAARTDRGEGRRDGEVPACLLPPGPCLLLSAAVRR